jgi:hypothetical protein
MSHSVEFKKNTLALDTSPYPTKGIFQKGQKILFEGEKAKVISIKPILVIKTKDRVVCGYIQKRIRCIE